MFTCVYVYDYKKRKKYNINLLTLYIEMCLNPCYLEQLDSASIVLPSTGGCYRFFSLDQHDCKLS